MTLQEMQAQKDKNSAAWHGADKATQDRLHQENIRIQRDIDAANKTTTTFDPKSGTWGSGTTTSTTSDGGGTTSYQPSTATTSPNGGAKKAPGMDDLGNVDQGQRWDSELSGKADYDTLLGIYNDRQDKIDSGDPYGQFAGDAKSKEMEAWLKANEPKKPQTSGGNDYSGYIEDMYAAKQKAALDALRSAYDKNVAGLDRAQAAIAPQYQGARNDAAGQAELQKKNFAEYALANGLNSGAGGQAQLAFGNALQKNLSDISQKEATSMADLELQRSQMETDFNNAIAQAEAQGNYELAQQLYAEKVRQDELMLQQMQWQAQQDLAQQQLQWQKGQADIANSQWDKSFGTESAQNDKTWALKMAQEMAQYGNFDGYKALGYSETDIQGMKDYWDWMQQQSAAKATTGGGGKTGIGTGTLSAKDAFSQFNNGYDTPEIRAAIEPVYGKVWGEDAPGISDYNQLGAAAQGIINAAAHSYGGTAPIADQVERAIASGSITQAEADFILKSIGY